MTTDNEPVEPPDSTTTTAAPARPRRGLGANYWKLFSSSTLANLGDGLMAVAIVWLASSLTRDPMVLALIGLATRLPWLLFSLPAGVIADRVDRRLLVGWMDVVRVGVIGVLGALIATRQAGLPTPQELDAGAAAPQGAGLLLIALFVASMLIGFAEVVRDNAAQTLMPSVVDRQQLERANGRMWGAEMTMNNFIGPPLAGVLLGVALVIPFVINAGLLAISAALIFALSGTFLPRAAGVASAADTSETGVSGPAHEAEPSSAQIPRPRPSWTAELAEGFSWLWRNRLLRTLALMLGTMNFLSALSGVIMILFVQEVLGLFEGWQFGLLITGGAIGAVLASFGSGQIADRVPPGAILMASVVGMGTSSVLLGLTSVPVLAWLSMGVGGVFIVLWNVVTVSLRQRIIPDRLLGRVNSVYRFFGWGTIAVGTLLGGVIVTVLEPAVGREWALRAPFLVAGVATLTLLVVAVRYLRTDQIRSATAAAQQDVV